MRRTLSRAVILVASVVVAATAFYLTDSQDEQASRDDGTALRPDAGGEPNTMQDGTTTVYRLGASAYFPQGTNPPIGSGLAGARRGLSIELQATRYDGETVTAFGVFIEGEPECDLLSEPGGRKIPVSEAEMELAGDAFSYTATPDEGDSPDGLTVHCELSGRPADMDEVRVEAR